MMFLDRKFALLLFCLAISGSGFCQDKFLDENDIIEQETFHCKGSGHGLDVTVNGDTVTLFGLGKSVHYVNDSTRIFGYSNYDLDLWIEFDCDTVKGCQFWLSEYEGQNRIRTKVLLLDTSLIDFEYALDGIEMGFFDRRFSNHIQKKDGVIHVKSD